MSDAATATLVPELGVTKIDRSLAFYRTLGFTVLWQRPEEGFACIERAGARIMLDEIGRTRSFGSGALPEHPFGRGMNLEITVPEIGGLIEAARGLGATFVLEPERRSYRTGATETRVEQFVIADPDGYLLRFSQPLDPS